METTGLLQGKVNIWSRLSIMCSLFPNDPSAVNPMARRDGTFLYRQVHHHNSDVCSYSPGFIVDASGLDGFLRSRDNAKSQVLCGCPRHKDEGAQKQAAS